MLNVSLRNNAIFVPASDQHPSGEMTPASGAFVSELDKYGYEVSEQLLHVLNGCNEQQLNKIADALRDAFGIGLNWSALVRGWQTPTGESVADHLVTLFVNAGVVDLPSVTLPCGHRIPEGTFPLQRYTGCPFCGKPFVISDYTFVGQGSKKKILSLWSEDDLQNLMRSLLESKVPLDATATDSLRQLLNAFPLPDDVDVTIREVRIVIASVLMERGDTDAALKWLHTPTDLLRLVWYQRTGSLRIVPPKVYRTLQTDVNRDGASHGAPRGGVEDVMGRLKLKFSRSFSKWVAWWFENLPMTPEAMCEDMHSHRGMWVRMIRALRLAEYARRPEMQRLARLLDLFYRGDYRVWQGLVDQAVRDGDAQRAFMLLRQRPGAFARSLFSMIARFGLEPTLEAFEPVLQDVAPRILLSLSSVAEIYFLNPEGTRSVGAPGLRKVAVELPKAVRKLSDQERTEIIVALNELYVKAMEVRFAKEPRPDGSIYIAPELYSVPVPVGERTTVKSDLPPAYQGQRFAVEGDAVRLFLQWGVGLPAQWLDMDLSAVIVGDNGRREECAYYNLAFSGARHSGDIRQIPDQVGTAEYVELELPRLEADGWKYAAFTCNAYSSTQLDPRLVVGWMSSAYPMAVSDSTGVAYDPSTVQHIVRISEGNLMRGLVFGFLDIKARTIYWLEMPLTSRIAAQLNTQAIEAYIRRLKARPTIGRMLADKAAIQGTPIATTPQEAVKVFDADWAYNAADVAAELL